jgi:brefeldin A-inhibited guanine nucleotide-exchange protein
MKFLKKEELAISDFQRQFLKPFETIFMETPPDNVENRDLILRCLDNIISHSVRHLKSGWKIIFDILNMAAASEKDLLIEQSFRVLQTILAENLPAVNDYMLDLLDVLLKFIRCKNEEIVKASLDSVVKIITSNASIKSNKPVPKKLSNEKFDPEKSPDKDEKNRKRRP